MHSLKGKFLAACVAVFAAVAYIAAPASAAIEIDAEDFTKPVETQMSAAVPIVVAFIAAIFVVGFLIRWIQRRASSAK